MPARASGEVIECVSSNGKTRGQLSDGVLAVGASIVITLHGYVVF
jgi:hypothetical protein